MPTNNSSFGDEMANSINTTLSSEQEKEFLKWMQQGTQKKWRDSIFQKYNEEPNLNTPDYDYRAAFKANVPPVIYSGDGHYHWDSRFKGESNPRRIIAGTDTKNNNIVDLGSYLEYLFTPKMLRSEDLGE